MFEDADKYLSSVLEATTGNEGQMLSSLISLRDAHVKIPTLHLAQPEELVQKVGLSQPVNDLISAHLKVIYHLTRQPANYIKAFTQQDLACRLVARHVQEHREEVWCLPLMCRLCLDLGSLAKVCEKRCRGIKLGQKLEEAADCIMGCFRICADAKGCDNARHLGMLILVNRLFKIYFLINKRNLCPPLIKAIENCTAKDAFPMQEQITYNYYVGIVAMFDAKYTEAMEKLTFSFNKCPARFTKNKRLILLYLVPVKMLLGYMPPPTKDLLERYDLLLLHDLALAAKAGNVGKFDGIVRKQELFLMRSGIYLVVQKLKHTIYRNLFKKEFLIRQSHQLDISDFQAALQFAGMKNVTMNEVHCILVNLIHDGKIRGYISHEHNKLVVSKQNPFPALIAK
ncbi:hypothetical protein KR038_008780 [Drosophila bunnanda]|nr:hypothetical protein KR038_008780 [Drosophila bunnanda]